MDLISIIVPVYNVESYLPECLESIAKQTYKNLQIILVDDGSKDLSPIICDEWAKKDIRVKVIHKVNGGLSDARNEGLKNAVGEYVCFVDSDDILNPDFVKLLYDAIIQCNTPISACKIQCFFDGDIPNFEDVENQLRLLSAEEALEQILDGNGVSASACNKMYTADLLKGESFVYGKHHEDEFFTYRIIDRAEQIAYTNSALYYYRQRAGSIMTSFSIKRLDALEAFLERLMLLYNKYPNLYKKDKAAFCVACVSYYKYALAGACEQIDYVEKKIKQLRRKIKFSFTELLAYSFKSQIYIVGSLFPKLTCKAMQLIRGVQDE